MTTISDLSKELVEEILSRVPITSLKAIRSTCKRWNALSKNHIFGKTGKQFVGFMMKDYKVCSVKFDLKGLHNEDGEDLVDISIKQVALLDQLKVSEVYHCDGLLLCVIKENNCTRLVVWNPYLRQTRWIRPSCRFTNSDRFALGYDKNHNYKILRIYYYFCDKKVDFCFVYEVYDFSSDLWKAYHLPDDLVIPLHQRSVSLKGNSYFLGRKKKIVNGEIWSIRRIEDNLLCFDFTTEKFGPPLPLPQPLPVHTYRPYTLTLSCVEEERLALFSYHHDLVSVYEVWVTNKIDSNTVSWSKFLKSFDGADHIDSQSGSFFIDEEKKVAVFFDLDHKYEETRYQTAHIIGEDGYFKSVNIGEAPNLAEPYIFGHTPKKFCFPLVCSWYVPSLVQLQINQAGQKRKTRDY